MLLPNRNFNQEKRDEKKERNIWRERKNENLACKTFYNCNWQNKLVCLSLKSVLDWPNMFKNLHTINRLLDLLSNGQLIDGLPDGGKRASLV